MWLEIDVGALVGNLAAIRQRVAAGTAVWPVVKADGYGHGLEVAARAFLCGWCRRRLRRDAGRGHGTPGG